jgi:hypothetical protein
MKRWILAVAVLLGGAVGLASADYVIIVANLGQPTEQPNPFPGGPFPGGGFGALGARGGALGVVGGGALGVGGMPFPGGGARGGPPFPGGMVGGQFQGGMGAVGARGGPPFPGGNVGGPGMVGGGPGMVGGGARGMVGGPGMVGGGTFIGQPGQPGGPGGDITNVDPDALPYLVKVVVEVNDHSKGDKQKLDYGIPIKVRHQWGESAVINIKGSPIHVTFLPYSPVAKRYDSEAAKVLKDKPSTEQVLGLAEWALQHGLLSKFTGLMDKLVQEDKDHPVVAAYSKVKADLAREVTKDDAAVNLKAKLAEGYKATQSKYYTVLHNSPTADPIEIKSRLERLDDNLRAFYYFFTLRKMTLPVPKERLVALVVNKDEEFHNFHDMLAAGPVVADGFFARRENLAVLSSNRMDEQYHAIDTNTQQFWNKGYSRQDLLSGKKGVGYPPTTPPLQLAEVQTYALLLKAMEADSELASISHDATRQLIYAAGLLPRNVAAPEWLLFGVASFFETPTGAPWPTTGAPSGEHLPIFKVLTKTKKLDKPYEALVQVVTDGYFRQSDLAGDKQGGLRKARATAWSLAYFLIQKKPEALQRYAKEIGKMPRDIDLDGEVLLSCFAKALDCTDKDQKPDRKKLENLANQWLSYIENTRSEEEEILEAIKKNLNEMKTQPGKTDKPTNPPGGGGSNNQ